MCHIQGKKHRTWSTSAKLAAFFPGFSFVTWLVLCNRKRFFLSRVLLLGFGKLLSIKEKVALPLCCDVRGFYHELSKYVTIKVASARRSPVAFFYMPTIPRGPSTLFHSLNMARCRFVVMCVGFTTNCQNTSQSKSLLPDIHPLLFFTYQDAHRSTSRYIADFVHDETHFKACA